MIRLKNIEMNELVIHCDILPEDSQEFGYIEVDKKTEEITKYNLPIGYEWCKSHLCHAKNALIEMVNNPSKFSRDKSVMWY